MSSTNTPAPLTPGSSLNTVEQQRLNAAKAARHTAALAASDPLAAQKAMAAASIAASQAGLDGVAAGRPAPSGFELSNEATPYQPRAGASLVAPIIAPPPVVGAMPPGHMAVMPGGKPAAERVRYLSAPQFSGETQAPRLGRVDRADPAKAIEGNAGCGEYVIAEHTAQIRLPNGQVTVVASGSLLIDPGAIYLCREQGMRLRPATKEEIDSYFGRRAVDRITAD